ncbi:MAG: excinuclease ABC subunit C [Flavobacteriaceae bacterium]|nr:excinuclease ABC subunit C [Flavobacteriaceae bacterium]|tara:strand:- start:43864 stop:44100 length:237 start_codon:yes stop_codon:yes gene_type:complete
MNYVVYILYSEKLNKYYVGQTQNLEERVRKHNQGGAKFTSTGKPWLLIKSITVESRREAIQLERKIKKRGIQRYLNEN